MISKNANRAYTQARVWHYDEKGILTYDKDIDFTDHGSPAVHPNAHQHRYIPNSTGGAKMRSKNAEPVSINNENLKSGYGKNFSI